MQVLLTCNLVINKFVSFPLSVKQVDSFRLLRMSISELLDAVNDCMHFPGKTVSDCAHRNCNQSQNLSEFNI